MYDAELDLGLGVDRIDGLWKAAQAVYGGDKISLSPRF